MDGARATRPRPARPRPRARIGAWLLAALAGLVIPGGIADGQEAAKPGADPARAVEAYIRESLTDRVEPGTTETPRWIAILADERDTIEPHLEAAVRFNIAFQMSGGPAIGIATGPAASREEGRADTIVVVARDAAEATRIASQIVPGLGDMFSYHAEAMDRRGTCTTAVRREGGRLIAYVLIRQDDPFLRAANCLYGHMRRLAGLGDSGGTLPGALRFALDQMMTACLAVQRRSLARGEITREGFAAAVRALRTVNDLAVCR